MGAVEGGGQGLDSVVFSNLNASRFCNWLLPTQHGPGSAMNTRHCASQGYTKNRTTE